MPAFEFYIATELSAALAFRVVLVKDAARAREVAEAVLRESPTHIGVEVRQASKVLFAIGSMTGQGVPPLGGDCSSNRAPHSHA